MLNYECRIMNEELLICSVSGGKDSTALYCLMVEYYGKEFLPIFADTGNEHPVTVNYVRNLHIMANGPQIQIVKADFTDKLQRKGLEPFDSPFLDLMRWKGRAPSTKAQFCTEWLKLWPMKLFLEASFPFADWKMFTGIRQQESERRKRAYPEPFTTNTYFDCDAILPLLYETEDAVFQYLEERDVPPNPLYALGYNRVGCFPCIHANKNQLQLLPEWAWEKLQYWESRIGRSWFSSGVLPNKPPGYIPSIPEVREWCKTTRGGKTYDMFKQENPTDAPACLSTWGQCE